MIIRTALSLAVLASLFLGVAADAGNNAAPRMPASLAADR